MELVLAVLSWWLTWDGATAIATWALVVVGIIAVFYAAGQLRGFRSESRIKHLIDLVDQFEREPLATYRRQLGLARTPNRLLTRIDLDDPPAGLHDIMNFFEHMGYLLAGGYIDLDGVSVEFHYWILHVWADAREVIKHEQQDDPVYYEYFDKMVTRLLEYDRPRTGKLSLPSTQEIEDFYVEEALLPTGSPLPRRRRVTRRGTKDQTAEHKANS